MSWRLTPNASIASGTIVASANGVSSSSILLVGVATVPIVAKPVSSIRVTPATGTFRVGERLPLIAVALDPQGATIPVQVQWAVDRPTKAFVTAVGSGIVYVVKPFVYDRIDKKRADFRDAPKPSPGAATPAAPPPAMGGMEGGEDSGDMGDEGGLPEHAELDGEPGED